MCSDELRMSRCMTEFSTTAAATHVSTHRTRSSAGASAAADHHRARAAAAAEHSAALFAAAVVDGWRDFCGVDASSAGRRIAKRSSIRFCVGWASPMSIRCISSFAKWGMSPSIRFSDCLLAYFCPELGLAMAAPLVVRRAHCSALSFMHAPTNSINCSCRSATVRSAT